eukprot:3759465-Lingulodinium_polyedra.AAC.1
MAMTMAVMVTMAIFDFEQMAQRAVPCATTPEPHARRFLARMAFSCSNATTRAASPLAASSSVAVT